MTSSNDTLVPIVAANAMSSTTTRPRSLSARGNMRGAIHTNDPTHHATPATISSENGATFWANRSNGIEATAAKAGDGFAITGSKMFVLDGAQANLLIVAAKTAAGVSLFAVDPTAEGVTRTNLSTMDQTRKQAKIDFAGTPGTLIGTDGGGWATLERVLDLTAVALAAEQVGAMQTDVTALRLALLRRFVGQARSRAVKAPSAEEVLSHDVAPFAAEILKIARSESRGVPGARKAYIADVWKRLAPAGTPSPDAEARLDRKSVV